MRTVTLYGKPDCCLCERAHAVLERLGAGQRFALEQVDITAEEVLHKRFLVRIPVVALDGEELYDYEIDEQDLVARLGEAPPAAGRS
jgi:glutaredoxin